MFSFVNCFHSDLKVENIVLCDNFTLDGKCVEEIKGEKTYNITVPSGKRVDTWDELTTFMLHNLRIKPGFIIKFNRNFTPSERKSLIVSYKAAYYFWDSRGTMEDIEIGKNRITSKEYLSDIIKYRQLEKANLYLPIELKEIFPVEIKFYYFSDLVNGEIPFKINLNIRYNTE